MQGCTITARRSSSFSSSFKSIAGASTPPTRGSSLNRAGLRLSSAFSGRQDSPAVAVAPATGSTSPLTSVGKSNVSPSSGGYSGPSKDNTAVVHFAEEPVGSGLTVASLKHLRRQRDRLAEEKDRLQADYNSLLEKWKEQKDRITELETSITEANLREASTREELSQAREDESRQRCRAIESEDSNRKLQEMVGAKDGKIERLKMALEEKPHAQTAGPISVENPLLKEIEEANKQLEGERDAAKTELQRLRQNYEDLQQSAASAMASAEKAMAMHAYHDHLMTSLKGAKLAEAINEKVELHISVPRVTLTYNNAPPLFISAASGLSDARVRDFLNKEIFPKFEPLWIRMDCIDAAPDGSSKRVYCSKMLDKLTEAVKLFVKKSQQADEDANLGSVN